MIPKLERLCHKSTPLIKPLCTEISTLSDDTSAGDSLMGKAIKRGCNERPSHTAALSAGLDADQVDLAHTIFSSRTGQITFRAPSRLRDEYLHLRILATALDPDPIQFLATLPRKTPIEEEAGVLVQPTCHLAERWQIARLKTANSCRREFRPIAGPPK